MFGNRNNGTLNPTNPIRLKSRLCLLTDFLFWLLQFPGPAIKLQLFFSSPGERLGYNGDTS